MLETNLVKVRLSVKYPDPADSEKSRSFTYANLSLMASDGQLYELADAFTSLMYNPAMEAEFIKSETTDLYMA